MTDEASFVEEIRQQPHDIVPRLVYADFLEEAGDPRGELIRVQCELSESQPGDAARPQLMQRERELLDEFAEQWLSPLRALGAEGISARCFQRGLIERVRIAVPAFLENADQLCRLAPALFSLELRGAAGAAMQLASTALPAQIHEVDLGANRLDAEWMATVQGAPWLEQIRSLHLQVNRLGDDGMRALTQAECPRLTALNLASNKIGPAGIRRLGQWASLEHVERLSLSTNEVGQIGLTALGSSRFLTSLKALELASCGIQLLRGLANSHQLPELRELNLRGNTIDQEGWDLLSKSEIGLRLTRLDGRNNSSPPPELPPGS